MKLVELFEYVNSKPRFTEKKFWYNLKTNNSYEFPAYVTHTSWLKDNSKMLGFDTNNLFSLDKKFDIDYDDDIIERVTNLGLVRVYIAFYSIGAELSLQASTKQDAAKATKYFVEKYPDIVGLSVEIFNPRNYYELRGDELELFINRGIIKENINVSNKITKLFNSVNDEKIILPKYLTDQYEFWMYNERLAKAFDDKFERRIDNPITNRGLNSFTLDWMLTNQNTPTSYYGKLLPLDPLKLGKILGLSGEHTYINKPEHKARILDLAKQMKDTGYNMSAPILIDVTKNGPRIVEGNHRVRAAIEAGLHVIPVEWRWVGGTDLNRLHHPIQYVTLKSKET